MENNIKDGRCGRKKDIDSWALREEPSSSEIPNKSENPTCSDCVSRMSYIGVEIATLPSVQPKSKTGHWIEKAEDYYKAINEYGGGVDENTDYFTDDIACPKCLSKFSTIDNETERFRYCPNCGAEMSEVEE
jgi:predicted amidophosphoribosyltransferase